MARLWSGDRFPVILSSMTARLAATLAFACAAVAVQARQPDYSAHWQKAVPFHVFLENVKARQDQWKPRFANAAIDAAALTEARALPAKRRILAVADDRCSDSAWAIPYIAKLAAAVPDKLELRVISSREGRGLQRGHLTPDGRLATPTVLVLDENDRFIGAWVEHPSALQAWYIENKPRLASDDLYAEVAKWYTDDAGRSTIRELLVILGRVAAEGT